MVPITHLTPLLCYSHQWLQLSLCQMPPKYATWILSFKSVFPPIIWIFPQGCSISTSYLTCPKRNTASTYVFFHDLLLPLNFIFWRFTLVDACRYSSFIFTALLYSTIWTYFNLFHHSTWDIYLGSLPGRGVGGKVHYFSLHPGAHLQKKFPGLWR